MHLTQPTYAEHVHDRYYDCEQFIPWNERFSLGLHNMSYLLFRVFPLLAMSICVRVEAFADGGIDDVFCALLVSPSLSLSLSL